MPCAAGTADVDSSPATQCEDCPAGTQSSTGAVLCDVCPVGTADTDSDAATPCEAVENQCATRDCPADFDNDGRITTDDLLTLLALFGRESCEANVAGGIMINTDDLLTLLSQFGQPC